MATGPIHLIATGVARSGTTALAELLNSHPRICVGIERFKFRYLLENDYSADFFTRERFFDFREKDTNLRPAVRPHWQATYDAIARKWDKAGVIGDKVPDLTPVLADFMTANPDFRFIYVLRNLKDVGLSWQARADKPRDPWPVTKNFTAACESWFQQMRQLHQMLRDRPELRDRLLLLDYDAMYDADSPTERALLGFLGLEADAGFHDTFNRHVGFANGRTPRTVPAEHVAVYKLIDMAPAKALRKEARRQARHWAGLPPEAAAKA